MASPIRHQLSQLLGAYGYNLYDRKNRARSDDLLVREQAASALADAAGAIAALRTAYRRRFVPNPTREHPDPPPEHMAQLRALAGLQDRLASLETRIRSMPVPTQDAVWERFRRERTLLDELLTHDYNLIAPCQDLRERVKGVKVEEWGDSTAGELASALEGVEQSVRARSIFLEVS